MLAKVGLTCSVSWVVRVDVLTPHAVVSAVFEKGTVLALRSVGGYYSI
jgi:hypothetical protein